MYGNERIFDIGKKGNISGLGKQARFKGSSHINLNSVLLGITRISGLLKIDGDVQTEANCKLTNVDGLRSLAKWVTSRSLDQKQGR